MPEPKVLGKRRIPTSSAMLQEEIDEIQDAARAKRMTMSDFIRGASVKEARKVNRRTVLSPLARAG